MPSSSRRAFIARAGQAALGVWLLPRAVSAQRTGPWTPLIADVEKLVPTLLADARVPGLSMATVRNGALLWRRGFGVRKRDAKELVDEATVFECASLSKPVFAYAVMKLSERGVIDLDAPLTRYAPKPFLEGDPRLGLITARHVLSHTSGFQNWRSDAEPLKIHDAPGTTFRYSGEGYAYLQSVVAHLTRQPIEPFMKARLFKPFGMTSSGYLWNDTFTRHAAQPHDKEGAPSPNRQRTEKDVAHFAAAGGLYTTPTDYARFVMEVVNQKRADEFRLEPETLKEMVRPRIKIDETTSWAHGWAVQHTKDGDLIQHGGSNPGYRAYVIASVERKSGVVVMSNGDNGDAVVRHPPLIDLLTRICTV